MYTDSQLRYQGKEAKKQFFEECDSQADFPITEKEKETIYGWLQEMAEPMDFHFGQAFKSLKEKTNEKLF